jgi:hypothetical protein
MTTVINGSSPSITFSDGTTQTTSAVVSGKVPYSIMPAGSVLQVVNALTSTYTGINSQSFQAVTNLTASITPLFNTSTILVLVSIGEIRSAGNIGARVNLYRNGSSVVCMADELGYDGAGTANPTFGLTLAYSYVDSPATTSSTTYAVYARKITANSGEVQIMPNGTARSNIILMEIAG